MKIVIWTGNAWETWGPHSIDAGGIGGSETAAIRIAKHLAVMGHEVSIIGQVTPGTFDGVEYLDFQPFAYRHQAVVCDVFISSRDLSALRLINPVAATTGRQVISVLWMHDVSVGDDWRGEMPEYTYVFCLSPWAKKVAQSYYSHVRREKFILTRNGIEPSMFSPELGMPWKSTGKVVYSSSPDRGLNRLLDYWPDILKMEPSARLHVYYGFDTWKKMAAQRRDKDALLTIQYYESRLEMMADQRVVNHGRVGQAELTKAWLDADLWLYPTNFTETSCITAMEAQAAGAWPITTRLAALPDTIRDGAFVDPPNTRDGYREEFLSHVADALLSRDSTIGMRRYVIRQLALADSSWRSVAEEWSELFYSSAGKT